MGGSMPSDPDIARRNRRSKYIMHAIMAVIIVGVVVFTDRKGSDSIAERVALAGMFLLLYLAIASRRAHNYITGNTWKIYALGLLAFGLGVATFLFAASNISPTSKFADAATQISVGFFFLGMVLVILPRATKGYRDYEPASKRVQQRPAPSPIVLEFPGIDAGLDAVKYVLRNIIMFLRIAGPWALVIWAVPPAVVQLVAYGNGKIANVLEPVGTKMAQDVVSTISLASLVIVGWLSVPVIAVAWHRYVLENRIPKSPLAIPDLRARRYFALTAITIAVLGAVMRVERWISTDLANLVGNSNAVTIESIGWWIFLALFVFASSPFAIMLPGVAIDDWDSDPLGFILGKGRLTRSIGVGAPFAVAPFILAQQVFALTTQSRMFPVYDLTSGVESFVQVLLLVAALAAWATYLSRAYEFVKGKLPQPTMA
jgi:hypothetical protein